jgi:predicted amidophosphoribosyltransferase
MNTGLMTCRSCGGRFTYWRTAELCDGCNPPVQSPVVRRALAGSLPYKVHTSLHTDVRTDVVRETVADLLRRTMPPVGEVS